MKKDEQKPKSTGDPKTDALRAEVRRRLAEEDALRQLRLMGFTTPADLPEYVPDERNPDVLVRGRWLERGGSAWIVSTSGTGKSIHAMQLMLSFALGKPFCGLVPNGPLHFWYIQSEDSSTRLAIDRDDTTAELIETWTDTLPDVWREAWKRIYIVPIKGCGAAFINDLAMKLETARNLAVLPDVIVINPFLAIVGGPVVDGSFVTPFLRGGCVASQPTEGLQHVLEHYRVGALIYHQNALWALRRVAEVWGGEVEPVVAVSGGRVASRSIRLAGQLGSWHGVRFTYGKNMVGCTRTVLEQDVYTALYGFGAGLPVTDEDGRYTRRPASKPS